MLLWSAARPWWKKTAHFRVARKKHTENQPEEDGGRQKKGCVEKVENERGK